MTDERNQNQITRKDAKNCFVESLSDVFAIGKIHFNFAAYDPNKPAGQRQTAGVHIFIAADEFMELCRKLSCGEFKFMWQQKKKNNDKDPLYQSLGGTSAEKLAKQNRSRPDGMSLSRTFKIMLLMLSATPSPATALCAAAPCCSTAANWFWEKTTSCPASAANLRRPAGSKWPPAPAFSWLSNIHLHQIRHPQGAGFSTFC